MPDDLCLEDVAIISIQPFEQFLQELKSKPDPESQLQYAFQFMERMLASATGPDFKAFWDVRKLCLDLFRERLSPTQRSHLWRTFSDLSKEARKLKELLDQQSDFTAEQIDIAIKAVENDVEQADQFIANSEDLLIHDNSSVLSENYGFYNAIQKELNFLNLMASKINSLRKELIKTEMRIRTKNQFFDRLSKIGNAVFPRRKDLIQEISQAFEKDVDHFAEVYFSASYSVNEPLSSIRHKIQTLQAAASKLFTLSPQVFRNSRLKLSNCWDALKEKEKDLKQEFDRKKEVSKQNSDELIQLVEECKQKFEAHELSGADTLQEISEIQHRARNSEMNRQEIFQVRDAMNNLRDLVKEQQKAQEDERSKQELARYQAKKNLIAEFEGKIEAYLQGAQDLGLDEIQTNKEILIDEMKNSSLNKLEKQELEKRFHPLKEIIRRKKEEILMTLPEDERQALEQLREMLKEKKAEKDELKMHLEQLRKLAGSSGFDIQKAMEYDSRLKEGKLQFEQVQFKIKDLEQKIEELS